MVDTARSNRHYPCRNRCLERRGVCTRTQGRRGSDRSSDTTWRRTAKVRNPHRPHRYRYPRHTRLTPGTSHSRNRGVPSSRTVHRFLANRRVSANGSSRRRNKAIPGRHSCCTRESSASGRCRPPGSRIAIQRSTTCLASHTDHRCRWHCRVVRCDSRCRHNTLRRRHRTPRTFRRRAWLADTGAPPNTFPRNTVRWQRRTKRSASRRTRHSNRRSLRRCRNSRSMVRPGHRTERTRRRSTLFLLRCRARPCHNRSARAHRIERRAIADIRRRDRRVRSDTSWRPSSSSPARDRRREERTRPGSLRATRCTVQKRARSIGCASLSPPPRHRWTRP